MVADQDVMAHWTKLAQEPEWRHAPAIPIHLLLPNAPLLYVLEETFIMIRDKPFDF